MDVKAQNMKYKLQNWWRVQTAGWEKVPPRWVTALWAPAGSCCAFLLLSNETSRLPKGLSGLDAAFPASGKVGQQELCSAVRKV